MGKRTAAAVTGRDVTLLGFPISVLYRKYLAEGEARYLHEIVYRMRHSIVAKVKALCGALEVQMTDELLEVGNRAAFDALAQFGTTENFSTKIHHLLTKLIRQGFMEHFGELAWHGILARAQLASIRRDFVREHKRQPTYVELREWSKLGHEAWEQLNFRASLEPLPLDEFVDASGMTELESLERYGAAQQLGLEWVVHQRERSSAVEEALSMIPKARIATAIRGHVLDERTLEDVGVDLGLGRMGVSNLVKEGIRKLRYPRFARLLVRFY